MKQLRDDRCKSGFENAATCLKSGFTNVQELLAELTLPEKLALLSGQSIWKLPDVPRLNISSIACSDGPNGVRKQLTEMTVFSSHPATCFPTSSALASSWDEELVEETGQALARECLYYNVRVLLAPGLNLKRHPAGGRNFEYFSEDPLVSGRSAAAYVRGVQRSGKVGGCGKHFAINNQETSRFVVNAVVDERTARELYLRSFEYVLSPSSRYYSPPASVMCAYNAVNGAFCSENEYLLTRILRDEWNYSDVVMTDWGATNDRVAGIAAGLDLEMPGTYGLHHRQIKKALRDGRLTMKAIDQCVERVLRLICKYQDDPIVPEIDWKAHGELARKIARDCVVLLKNDRKILPLKKNSSVSLIGAFGKDEPRFQAMGSAQVNAKIVLSAMDEMRAFTDTIYYSPGYIVDGPSRVINQALIDEAVQVARKGDVVVLFCGLDEIAESEGFDRTEAGLPAQHVALIEAVSKIHDKVVLVLSNGGAVELPSVCDDIPAILEGYLLGQSGGGAIVDLLFGVQSPCGKLAETMPIRVEDVLADSYFPGNGDVVEYREGLDVGYRYFDTAKKPVQYPFGHGLSYTTFKYSALEVDIVKDGIDEKQVNVNFVIENTGSMAGREVAQCYVHDVQASVYRPVQELRDFCKVLLQPGEQTTFTFALDTSAFAFYDIGAEDWIVEAGSFEIRIGSSSRDIRLKETIEFNYGKVATTLAKESYPPIQSGTLSQVDDVTFARRFGRHQDILERKHKESSGKFHRNSLLGQVAKSRILGYLLFKWLYIVACFDIESGSSAKRQKKVIQEVLYSLPLRALVLFGRGVFSWEVLDAFVKCINFQWYQAMCTVGTAFYHSLHDWFAGIRTSQKNE